MNRHELNAMLEVPSLMGRERPTALIIGMAALGELLAACEPVTGINMDPAGKLPGETILGFPVYTPRHHPYIGFFVNDDELPGVLERIGPLTNNMNAWALLPGRQNEQSDDHTVRQPPRNQPGV